MATNSVITKVTGTDTSSNRIASTFYGTCETAAATAEKAVTLSDSCVFNDSCLVTGATIHVKFTNSNTNATPTLKVGTATAKQIMAYGTTKAGTTATASWYAGSVVSFTYDGTYWIMNDYKTDTNTNTWRAVNVNGTQLLGTGTRTGAVNFKSGTNVTVSGSGNDITISATASGASTIPVTIPVSGWLQDTTNNYYYNDVTVSGVTASDNYEIVGFIPSSTISDNATIKEQLGYITYGITSAGTIQFIAIDEIPAIDLSILLRTVV